MNGLLVIADDRERSSGIPSLLEQSPTVDLRVERLSLGDYQVENTVLIERKSAADFAKSLIDGRLFEQASRLASSIYRPAFIIQGTAKEWNALGVRREALQGALITLMLIYDIPVFRAGDSEETARLIVYTGRQLARLRDPDHATYRQAKAKRKKTRQLRLLQTLPGVGGERSKLLLDYFGNVRACLNAPVEELQKVEGIGPKTAEAIHDIVRENKTIYGRSVKVDDLLL